MQNDWCPHNDGGNSAERQRCTEGRVKWRRRENTIRKPRNTWSCQNPGGAPWTGSPPQPSEGATPASQPLDFRFPASSTERDWTLLFKPPRSTLQWQPQETNPTFHMVSVISLHLKGNTLSGAEGNPTIVECWGRTREERVVLHLKVWQIKHLW